MGIKTRFEKEAIKGNSDMAYLKVRTKGTKLRFENTNS